MDSFKKEEKYSENKKEEKQKIALHKPKKGFKSAARYDWKTDKIPEEFCCHITHSIMEDPVVAKDGHTYEHTQIMLYITLKGKSPITRENLKDNEFYPNRTLKNQIKEYKKRISHIQKNPKNKLEFEAVDIFSKVNSKLKIKMFSWVVSIINEPTERYNGRQNDDNCKEMYSFGHPYILVEGLKHNARTLFVGLYDIICKITKKEYWNAKGYISEVGVRENTIVFNPNQPKNKAYEKAYPLNEVFYKKPTSTSSGTFEPKVVEKLIESIKEDKKLLDEFEKKDPENHFADIPKNFDFRLWARKEQAAICYLWPVFLILKKKMVSILQVGVLKKWKMQV